MERDDDVISLQDYLVVLRRQRWLVLSTVVLVVVAALAVSFAQTPVYEAEAELVVEPVRRTQDATLEELLSPQNSVVQTERLVVTSRPVAERVVEMLGLADTTVALEDLRVEAVADTRVLRIVASDTDPSAAADRADAFAEAYLDFRRDTAVEGLLAAREDLDARAAALRAQIENLEGPPVDENGEAAAADTAVEAERQALLTQLSAVVAQISEVGNAAEAVSGGGSILSPAEIPVEPVAPRPLRTGALAIVLGLLLGVGLAFLRDHVDDVVRDENDVKRGTGGMAVLGRIPTWDDPSKSNRLATIVEPSARASEAYRELSAGVRFLLLAAGEDDGDDEAARAPMGRSILVCSATAGDGKTSTAANLAVAAAKVGLRTVLVDADLRRPTVAARFGLGRSTGVTDLLLSGGGLREYAVAVGIDNLRILPAGTLPPNPHELLASAAMRRLERELSRRADLVIYDTPAVLATPDALELGRHVDAAIFVARVGKTGRREIEAALERLAQVGTKVAGTVINGLDSRNDDYYYSYYYADGRPAPTEDGKPSRRAAKKAGQAPVGTAPVRPASVNETPSPSARVVPPPATKPSPRAPAASRPSPDGAVFTEREGAAGRGDAAEGAWARDTATEEVGERLFADRERPHGDGS